MLRSSLGFLAVFALCESAVLLSLAAARPASSPQEASPAAGAGRLVLPPTDVPLRRWQYIVIHHSATPSGNAARFDAYHHGRGWSGGLAYHFVIGNGHGSGDGQIEVGPRWTAQQDGAHCHGAYNPIALGICLVGDLNAAPPTPRQMESLSLLVRALMETFDIPAERVVGHREVPGNATECPGRHMPLREFQASLAGRAAE